MNLSTTTGPDEHKLSVFFLQDWSGQNVSSIASEICGFITVLSGTIILHATREHEPPPPVGMRRTYPFPPPFLLPSFLGSYIQMGEVKTVNFMSCRPSAPHFSCLNFKVRSSKSGYPGEQSFATSNFALILSSLVIWFFPSLSIVSLKM